MKNNAKMLKIVKMKILAFVLVNKINKTLEMRDVITPWRQNMPISAK